METSHFQNQNQNQNRKAHAVIVPYPSTGHVNPHIQLAKLLHARGFHITFINTEFNHRRLVRANGPESLKDLPDFRFETIPDGLPQPARDDTKQPTAAVCESLAKNGLAPFRELLKKLNSDPDVPRVTCIVSDAVMTFTMQAAKELCVPEVQFWTASAIGLMGYYQYAELVRRGIVPLKDESYKSNGYLDTLLDWIPGTKQMRLKHMPSICLTTNPQNFMLNYMIQQTQNCKNSSGVIINTFDELEGDVLEALASIYPRIYTVGPLFCQLGRDKPEKKPNMANPSLWRENTECLDWLDQREAGSVVYVSFGSMSMLKEEQVLELAWGLASCGYHFLWILRPDIVMGESATLPEGFAEETRERGMVASWCRQENVLAHPSVGLFITHAGWNSVLESICCGVPVLCWPLGGDQTTNSRQVCALWGNGLQIGQEGKRSEIVSLIVEMMVGKRGKEMREKALDWKKKAEEATSIGGSSSDGLDKLINEVLSPK